MLTRPMFTQNNHQPSIQSPTKQKAESSPTGLHSLASDGPPRPDGSDKYFGMENVVGVCPNFFIIVLIGIIS